MGKALCTCRQVISCSLEKEGKNADASEDFVVNLHAGCFLCLSLFNGLRFWELFV